MPSVELITLLIAFSALITSCVTVYSMVLQSKNAGRSAVVLLEKIRERCQSERRRPSAISGVHEKRDGDERPD